jgi:hypothetical protein
LAVYESNTTTAQPHFWRRRFIAYGGWGFWVNMSHGIEMGTTAGLIQGSYSVVLTLSMTMVMESLMRMLAGTRTRQVVTVLTVSIGTLPWRIAFNG